MRLRILALLGFIQVATLAAQQSGPVSLTYEWQQGKTYRFRSVSTDRFTMKTMGFNASDQYNTSLDFGMYVVSVDPTGTANIQLFITNYTVRNSRGALVASLRNLPARMLFVPCQADRQGHFTFDKQLMLITASGGQVLSMEPDSIAGMPPDMQKARMVQAHAEFMPTGALKAGYVPTRLGTARRVQIRENQQSEKIPVFPYDCLGALALPEGEINTNDEVKMQSGFYETQVRVTAIDAQSAHLDFTLQTDTSNDMFEGNISMGSGGGTPQMDFSNRPPDMSGFPGAGQMPNMPGMPNMMGMGGGTPPASGSNPAKPFESQMQLSGTDQQMFQMMRSSMPVMDVRLKTRFDHVNKMFQQVGGTVKMEMNMPGMSMSTNSDVQLSLLP